MVINYDGRDYTLEIEDITLNQATFIKVKAGYTVTKWQDALKESDPDAIKALYWLMCNQSGVPAQWETIDFPLMKFLKAFAAGSKASREDDSVDESDPKSTSGTAE